MPDLEEALAWLAERAHENLGTASGDGLRAASRPSTGTGAGRPPADRAAIALYRWLHFETIGSCYMGYLEGAAGSR
ncbi:MAG: hypothetical protein LC792_19900 [Actinobacteria bacterium]|nr:hypothetical protein [Actinomycetota bacterium]